MEFDIFNAFHSFTKFAPVTLQTFRNNARCLNRCEISGLFSSCSLCSYFPKEFHVLTLVESREVPWAPWDRALAGSVLEKMQQCHMFCTNEELLWI